MDEIGRAGTDPVGERTLVALQQADAYVAWQVTQVADSLGTRILEVGAGIGNISAHLAASGPEALFLTDPNPAYLSRLRSTFEHHPSVHVAPMELPGMVIEEWQAKRLDTIVAFNVIEHVRDDQSAIRELGAALMPGGRLLLILPAHSSLYSSLDVALGHYRRYSARTAAGLLTNAGLTPVRTEYFNMAGAVGWYWRGRIRRKHELNPQSLRLFDRLVPLIRAERLLRKPFGLSVVAVAER